MIIEEWALGAAQEVFSDLTSVGWVQSRVLRETLRFRLEDEGVPFDDCNVVLMQSVWVLHLQQFGNVHQFHRPALEVEF